MNAYSKPLPVISEASRPFWEALRRQELRLPQCDACGRYRAYFERWCAHCGSERFTWAQASGRGTVWSHCYFHKVYLKGFEAEVPYNVSLVKLAEGPLLITNIPGARPSIGTPVAAVFDAVTADITLLKFRPA